ncbi:MAG: MFS transporter [Ardenticatenaceae bacterium]|nr:MFS transporter [Ardenticatenaceae bacterium]
MSAFHPTEIKSEKLPLWRKIGYGVGDIYGGGSLVVVNFFYLIFLTDVVRISPALAGTVILISKVYDSITDPFEGVLSDRTRTALGRRRPYLLAGIPLVFLSFIALFYPYSAESELARFALVILSYLFFSTIVSIVMLNYNALQAEITLDYDERTSLSGLRIFFSTLASIAAALLPLEIVKQFDDVRQGYLVMGVIFGAFFALPFIFTFFAARERQDFQKPPEKFDWRVAFLEPFKVKTFIYALLMYLFAFVAADTVSNIVVFFMKYYILRGDEANYVAGTLLVFQVLSLPFYSWLSKRTSKRTGFIVGAAVWLVTMLFSFFIGPGQPFLAVYTFAAIVGLGTGGVIVMMYAIFPDIPDVDELVSGERREGVYSALVTLVRKMSSAVAIFFVGLAIDSAGYIAPIEDVVDGTTQLVEQAQSDGFVFVLRMIFAILPIVLLVVSIYFARRYPLTPDVHERLNAVLAVKRGHGEATAVTRQEEAELKQLLV